MPRAAILALFMLLFSGVAAADSRIVVTLEGDCTQVACRADGTPYVLKDGTIVIYPGESLAFDFPAMGDTPGTPHFLADTKANPAWKPADGSTILTLDYSGGGMPMLGIRQTSSKFMKADLYLGRASGNTIRGAYTSSCALMPRVIDMEQWQQELGPLLVNNIRFLPDSNTMSCD
jgi:hypothetical protein